MPPFSQAVKTESIHDIPMESGTIEFFKVFLSSASSQQLVLPPAFGVVLNGKIWKKCSIKDPQGKSWPIELGKLGMAFVIERGWEKFAIYHGLVDGDFLIFDFMKSNQFKVKIFGKNGMIKDFKPSQPDDSVASSMTGIENAKPVLGKRTREKPSSSKNIERVDILISSSSDEEDNPSQAKRHRFQTMLTDATRYNVKLPKSFFPIVTKKGDKIALLNDAGKAWDVFIRCDNGEAILGPGWRQFWMQNKMVYGDLCVFEWIPSKERDYGSLRVLVSRSD